MASKTLQGVVDILEGRNRMVYTVVMDIDIGDDEIMEDAELEDAIKEMLNMVMIREFKVLEIKN